MLDVQELPSSKGLQVPLTQRLLGHWLLLLHGAQRSGNWRQRDDMLLLEEDDEPPMHWQHWPLQPVSPHEPLHWSVWPAAQLSVMRAHWLLCTLAVQMRPVGHCWNEDAPLENRELADEVHRSGNWMQRGDTLLLERAELLLPTH